MTIIQAIVLGFIQGITEFIPVSSSGHLVIIQHFFKGFSQPGVLFDAMLHLGTMIAVIFYFKDKIIEMFTNKKLLLLVILATIPTAIIGFSFKENFEEMFLNVKLTALALILTGIVVFIADRVKNGNKELKKTTWVDSIIVGIAQGIAIIPGISRSGSTISIGIFLNLDKKFAMEFSFLLSIPAILGAVILQLRHISKDTLANVDILPYIFGIITAIVTGYLSIRVLLNFLQKQRLYIFSIYCWLIGTAVVLI